MIPLAIPNLTGNEAEYQRQAIASGHIGPEGPFVERFEAAVAHASGRKWAVAMITGSAALHAAAYVLGFRGKQFNFHEHSFRAMWNIGQMLGCNAERVSGGESHDCALYRESYTTWPTVADCAPAIGNDPTTATVDCYSFAANKTVTTGQGGAVCGDDPALHDAIRSAVSQGYDRHGPFNYRMANTNAAIGCAQMERLDEFRDIKARIWDRYAEHMEMINRGPSRWMATARVSVPEDAGIAFRKEAGGVSLPCSTSLTEDEQDQVIRAVTND